MGGTVGFGCAGGWEDGARTAELEGFESWMEGWAGAAECNEAYSGMGHEAVLGR